MLYSFTSVAIAKYHRLGDLNSRNFFPQSFGGWKSKIKVLAGFVSSEVSLLAKLLCPWNSPGKNNGVGCHSLLQGIFQTQGLNLDLLHFRQILYCLSNQESPLMLRG